MYVTHLINLEGGGFSPLSPPPKSDPDTFPFSSLSDIAVNAVFELQSSLSNRGYVHMLSGRAYTLLEL